MISAFKLLVKKILELFDLHIFKKYDYDFGADESLKKLFKIFNMDCNGLVIFDIGANIGQSIERFKKNFPDPYIYSFEPQPETYSALKAKYDNDPKCHLYNLGLGSVNDKIIFYDMPDKRHGSFIKFNPKGAPSHTYTMGLKNPLGINNEILVDVTTINKFCANKNITNIDILKIDTQGYEVEVLKGGLDVLQNVRAIELEVMFSDLYPDHSTLGEISSILESCGFILWDIPVLKKYKTKKINRVNYCDIIFVNAKYLN